MSDRKEDFNQLETRGVEVPNGFICIPVNSYIDYELQSRALANIAALIMQECVEDSQRNYYHPSLEAENIAAVSYGFINVLTQEEAAALAEESEA